MAQKSGDVVAKSLDLGEIVVLITAVMPFTTVVADFAVTPVLAVITVAIVAIASPPVITVAPVLVTSSIRRTSMVVVAYGMFRFFLGSGLPCGGYGFGRFGLGMFPAIVSAMVMPAGIALPLLGITFFRFPVRRSWGRWLDDRRFGRSRGRNGRGCFRGCIGFWGNCSGFWCLVRSGGGFLAATASTATPSITAVVTEVCAFGVCRILRHDAFQRFFRDGVTNQRFNGIKKFLFPCGGQGKGLALKACAARSANAMDIILGMGGDIEIEHMGQSLDVNAAGCHIAANKEGDLAFLEGIQRFRADGLVDVAMQAANIESMFLQGTVKDVYIALAIAENEGAGNGFAGHQCAQGIALAKACGLDDRLLHVFGRGCRGGHMNLKWFGEEFLGKMADFRGHGRREKQGLPVGADQGGDFFDIRDETHVQHAVAFVKNEDAHVIHEDGTTFIKIKQAARCGNEDINAAVQLGKLVIGRDAANQQGGGKLVVLAVFGKTFLNLGGQFAGWLKDEGTRHARLGPASGQTVNQGKGESSGFSCARLCAGDEIVPGKNKGNGLLLDGGWVFITCVAYCAQDAGAQAKVQKCHSFFTICFSG